MPTESSQAGEDFIGTLRPDKRLRVFVIDAQICANCPFQLHGAAVSPAFDLAFGDQREEALDQIEPGSRGGREVHVKARIAREPRADRGRPCACRSYPESDVPQAPAGRSLRSYAGMPGTPCCDDADAARQLLDQWPRPELQTSWWCRGACSRACAARPCREQAAALVGCDPGPESGSSHRRTTLSP